MQNYTGTRQKNGRKPFCHSLAILSEPCYFLSAILHTFWQKFQSIQIEELAKLNCVEMGTFWGTP